MKDNKVVEVKCSDGSRSVYRYKNGALSEMDAHISIATVNMKRME